MDGVSVSRLCNKSTSRATSYPTPASLRSKLIAQELDVFGGLLKLSGGGWGEKWAAECATVFPRRLNPIPDRAKLPDRKLWLLGPSGTNQFTFGTVWCALEALVILFGSFSHYVTINGHLELANRMGCQEPQTDSRKHPLYHGSNLHYHWFRTLLSLI